MYATIIDEDAHHDTGHDGCNDGGELAHLFFELDSQGWPVRLMEQRISALLENAHTLEPEHRCAWLQGLHGMWQRHGWALTPHGRQGLLQLAVGWCAWPLAYAVGMSLRTDGLLDGDHALRLLDACRHLGKGDVARELSIGLQLAHPRELRYGDVHAELLAWLRWREGMPVIDGADRDDDELILEPLAHHHLPDFAWQYYDPAIAQLCCLPAFRDDTQWHHWLDSLYAEGDQRVFALLHREWGFIGCASLIMHAGVGFFYYWLGRDFQGHGLGPRAVSLMLSMAQQRHGLRCCYAKVFDYNMPSRRALEKLGFVALGLRGAAPNDDEIFYRWGEAWPEDVIVDELHVLLDRMGSDTRVAMPVMATSGPPRFPRPDLDGTHHTYCATRTNHGT